MSQWNVVLHMTSGKSHELSPKTVENADRQYEDIRHHVFNRDSVPLTSMTCQTPEGGKVTFHPRDVQSITLEEWNV